MVKQEFIELIESYLNGGDAPTDVRGKYHPREIEEWIASAMKLLIQNSKNDYNSPDVSALVQPYEVPISVSGSVYSGVLPASPLGGLETVYTVVGSNGNMIPLAKPGAQKMIMDYLKDCSCRAVIQGGSIKFDYEPSSPVVVNMIPNFSELDDDDQFNLPGDYSFRIIELIVSMLLRKKGTREDVKNNQAVDE